MKIIKLCADYGILGTFNDFIKSETEINLIEIIRKASNILELKEKQLKEEKQFLEYIQNEISLSQKLDSSINVDLEQTHEDFILIPFDDVFFQISTMIQLIKLSLC